MSLVKKINKYVNNFFKNEYIAINHRKLYNKIKIKVNKKYIYNYIPFNKFKVFSINLKNLKFNWVILKQIKYQMIENLPLYIMIKYEENNNTDIFKFVKNITNNPFIKSYQKIQMISSYYYYLSEKDENINIKKETYYTYLKKSLENLFIDKQLDDEILINKFNDLKLPTI